MGSSVNIRTIVAASLLAASACTVHQSDVPSLNGPSGLALSLDLTATPDSVTVDGTSQSAIVVEARNAAGDALVGLPVRLEILVGQTAQDCGSLSARNIVTGSDGRARSVYTVPSLPMPVTQCANFVSTVGIRATPTGSNFQTASSRSATIRLVPPGVILPPAGSPTASFTATPGSATTNSPVFFDASASTPGAGAAQIISYSWSFGDGGSGSGRTASNTYIAPNSYGVTLTVTNDRGLSASVTQSVAVGAGNAPTVVFTFGPTPVIVGGQVNFDAAGSKAGAGHSIVQYVWNWGDGNPIVTVATPRQNHIFATVGVFGVSLTVVDESGQQTVLTQPVTVGSGNPTASFTASAAAGSPPLHVMNLDGSASTAVGGATIVSYTWSFSDGSTALGPLVSKDFTALGAPGPSSVTLTVTDNAVPPRTGVKTQTVIAP